MLGLMVWQLAPVRGWGLDGRLHCHCGGHDSFGELDTHGVSCVMQSTHARVVGGGGGGDVLIVGSSLGESNGGGMGTQSERTLDGIVLSITYQQPSGWPLIQMGVSSAI